MSAKVELLIDHQTGKWKQNIIEENFNEDDVKQIISIPLGNRQPADRMVWKYTKHGFFIVKTAYHRAVSCLSEIHGRRPSTSSSPKEWKKLWKINVIPRVRMFLWRACTNSLPTRMNLFKRGCCNDLVCVLCGEEQETIDHLLLKCRVVFPIWYGGVLRIDVAKDDVGSFKDLLWSRLQHYPAEYVEIMAYNAWEIWKGRNNVHFQKKAFDQIGILNHAYSQWSECADRQLSRRESSGANTEEYCWEKPTQGRNKINCDVAVWKDGRIGMGFVLRDDRGQVILAGKSECLAKGSSTVLEGLGIRFALQMVKQYRLRADIIESDSKNCIDALNGKIKPDTYCDVIFTDIRELALMVECRCFKFIRRQSNRSAHIAAHRRDFLSINHAPNHLLDALQSDVVL